MGELIQSIYSCLPHDNSWTCLSSCLKSWWDNLEQAPQRKLSLGAATSKFLTRYEGGSPGQVKPAGNTTSLRAWTAKIRAAIMSQCQVLRKGIGPLCKTNMGATSISRVLHLCNYWSRSFSWGLLTVSICTLSILPISHPTYLLSLLSKSHSCWWLLLLRASADVIVQNFISGFKSEPQI